MPKIIESSEVFGPKIEKSEVSIGNLLSLSKKDLTKKYSTDLDNGLFLNQKDELEKKENEIAGLFNNQNGVANEKIKNLFSTLKKELIVSKSRLLSGSEINKLSKGTYPLSEIELAGITEGDIIKLVRNLSVRVDDLSERFSVLGKGKKVLVIGNEAKVTDTNIYVKVKYFDHEGWIAVKNIKNEGFNVNVIMHGVEKKVEIDLEQEGEISGKVAGQEKGAEQIRLEEVKLRELAEKELKIDKIDKKLADLYKEEAERRVKLAEQARLDEEAEVDINPPIVDFIDIKKEETIPEIQNIKKEPTTAKDKIFELGGILKNKILKLFTFEKKDIPAYDFSNTLELDSAIDDITEDQNSKKNR